MSNLEQRIGASVSSLVHVFKPVKRHKVVVADNTARLRADVLCAVPATTVAFAAMHKSLQTDIHINLNTNCICVFI